MTELEPWLLIRAQHRPTYVDLSNNRIMNFTNALRWSFDCNSTQMFGALELRMNFNNVRHISDVFSGWNIDGKLSFDRVGYRSVLSACH